MKCGRHDVSILPGFRYDFPHYKIFSRTSNISLGRNDHTHLNSEDRNMKVKTNVKVGRSIIIVGG